MIILAAYLVVAAVIFGYLCWNVYEGNQPVIHWGELATNFAMSVFWLPVIAYAFARIAWMLWRFRADMHKRNGL